MSGLSGGILMCLVDSGVYYEFLFVYWCSCIVGIFSEVWLFVIM